MIKIQEEDFDLSKLYSSLRAQAPGKTGAIALFCGLVREFGDQDSVTGIELEHYPGMTEKQLSGIVEQAAKRWPILGHCIVHRVGKLKLDDQIVAVGVSSSHRDAAFAACQFIMDYLKRDATIWKKELGQTSDWVEAKQSDLQASERWNKAK